MEMLSAEARGSEHPLYDKHRVCGTLKYLRVLFWGGFELRGCN